MLQISLVTQSPSSQIDPNAEYIVRVLNGAGMRGSAGVGTRNKDVLWRPRLNNTF